MTNIKIIPFEGQKTEALVFDMGGVLLNLDFNKAIDAFIKLGYENIERDLSKLLLSHPSDINKSTFHLYETGRIDSTRFRDELRKYSAKKLSDKDIDWAWIAMLQDLHAENIGILEKLRGSFRMFMLSNTNSIHIEYLYGCRETGNDFARMVQLFEKVYFSHEVGMRKPEAEIFEHMIEDAGLTPETTLFIDDSLHNVEAARAAGMKAYHHPKGENFKALFDTG